MVLVHGGKGVVAPGRASDSWRMRSRGECRADLEARRRFLLAVALEPDEGAHWQDWAYRSMRKDLKQCLQSRQAFAASDFGSQEEGPFAYQEFHPSSGRH